MKKKRVKIEHNKKLFGVFIFLLILLGILIKVIFIDETSINEECKVDSDCIKVQTTCCSCKMGGEEICVIKEKEQEYLDKLNECSDDIFCAAVYNCEISSCVCINNQCVSQ